MENEEKKEVVDTEVKVNEKNTETNETTEKKDVEKKEKTFTENQVNEIVEKRLAKAKKGIPSKEEMKQFNDWKESQKTEQEKREEKEKEYLKTQTERDNLQKENLLLREGVKQDDLDYVMFKVSKQEGEFKDNLEKFIKDNPKFLKSYEEPKKTIDLGSEHNDKKPVDDSFARKVMGLK